MLVSHGKFMRSDIGELVGPMPLDLDANPGLLTAGEQRSIAPFLRSRAVDGGEQSNGLILDDAGNVIGADPDNPNVKAQLAAQGIGADPSKKNGGLTNAQLQQLGASLGAGLSNIFGQKPPAAPPAPASIIPGVPNTVLAIVAVGLVLVVALKA